MGLYNKLFGKKNKGLEAQKKSRPIKVKESTETAEDHLRKAYTFRNDKKNLTEAIQECKTAIEINPNFVEAHCMLADIYRDQNNQDDAIQSYKDALHNDPNYALARSNLGMVYHLQGLDEEAIKEWEETLRRGASSTIRMNTENFIKNARECLAKRSISRKENEKENIVKPNIEQLITALNDENENVRKDAVFALGVIGDERAVELLIEACRDTNIYVRDRAATALVRVGEPAVKPLIQALKDENNRVRVNAASALGRIGHKRAVEPLINALKDEKNRRTVAEALGLIGDDRALEPLTRSLYDADELFQEISKIAIEKIKANKT